MQSFDSLNLKPSTLNAIHKLGFRTPTPIQAQAIPQIMAGHDVLGQAQTGTGKTAAFGLPLVELFPAPIRGRPTSLVLVPTRELAVQVHKDLMHYGHGTRFKATTIYGGVGYEGQRRDLASGHVACLVATPGRLEDHLQAGAVKLEEIRYLVLDEADRMSDMGFLPAVERILKRLNRDRITVLFSATLPAHIEQVARKHQRSPVRLETGEATLATPLAEQFRVEARNDQKLGSLLALLAAEPVHRGLIFVRTRHGARRLGKQLTAHGRKAEAIHGDLSQNQRQNALERFRDGRVPLLVATDVASRGLDIPAVSHVINYDLPKEVETYVHRIGRTARAGQTGRAFTLHAPQEAREMHAIERFAGTPLAPYAVTPIAVAPGPPRSHAPHPQSRHVSQQGRPPRPAPQDRARAVEERGYGVGPWDQGPPRMDRASRPPGRPHAGQRAQRQEQPRSDRRPPQNDRPRFQQHSNRRDERRDRRRPAGRDSRDVSTL